MKAGIKVAKVEGPFDAERVKQSVGIAFLQAQCYLEGLVRMRILSVVWPAAFASTLLSCPLARAGQGAAAPIPEIRQLIHEVTEHQKQLEKLRETYTYSSTRTVQDMDTGGQVKKTETQELEAFFVNGHVIERLVKKDGKALSDHDQQKEIERVTKLVEKAEKISPDQPLEGQSISVSRVLEIMDVRNPRRESYRGRMAIVFDFVGRKDAKTHGLAEDISKKLLGTMWVDEADRQVAHLEVTFNDNFKLAGGLLASIEKGSSFHFDQAQVNGEIWLPTGGEGNVQARLLMVKSYREHFTERDYDYKRFRVETQEAKDAKAVLEKK